MIKKKAEKCKKLISGIKIKNIKDYHQGQLSGTAIRANYQGPTSGQPIGTKFYERVNHYAKLLPSFCNDLYAAT
jgi:hypothetical protein